LFCKLSFLVACWFARFFSHYLPKKKFHGINLNETNGTIHNKIIVWGDDFSHVYVFGQNHKFRKCLNKLLWTI
jgi:hypothetical protein